MLKLNSILFYGMCIVPVFIDSAPLTDIFKQAPITDAGGFFSTNQNSEMLYKETTTNLNDVNSVHAQQKNKSDERSSILEHKYNSRDLDEEFTEFSAIPTMDDISNQNPITKKYSYLGKHEKHETMNSNGGYGDLGTRKRRSKVFRERITAFGNSAFSVGTPANPFQTFPEIFLNKIFLFNNQFNSSLEDDKENIGKTSFFLFTDNLPNPTDKFDS